MEQSSSAVDVAGLSKRFRFPAIPKRATLKDLVVRRIRQEGDYSVVDALADVTFSVDRGQTLGIVGSNGSGKSTLLRILAGIMKPDRGEMRLRGSVAPLLAIGTGFNLYLTGRENAIVELLTLGLSRSEARGLMDEVIEFSELAEFIDAPMRAYSAGMSMRLAFAAAICVDPDILLIDEVLAVGDAHFSAKCTAWLEGFRQRGKTTILVTHDTSTVATQCDVALWLDNGRVAAFGDPVRTINAYIRAGNGVVAPSDGAAPTPVKRVASPPGSIAVACTDTDARDQLAELRSRLLLRSSGPITYAGPVVGSYLDAWTNGNLVFSVFPVREITTFTMRVVIPERMPRDATIAVKVDGVTIESRPAKSGPLTIKCAEPLTRGQIVTIAVSTSATVCYKTEGISDDPRELGFYINDVAFEGNEAVPFTCNVCGGHVDDFTADLDPEGSPCPMCRSTIRLRVLIHLLSYHLHGRSLPAPDWPQRPDVTGFGISDWPLLSRFLEPVVSYTNTQYDPSLLDEGIVQLDITQPAPDLIGAADFVICSEVLEHVEPPVQRGFDGLYSLLKPGGILIFTVPYSLDETIEHFPNLHDWHVEERDGTRVLVNVTKDGVTEEFSPLVFHGGGADVLEMRSFGLEDVIAHLEAAGFEDVRVRQENVLDFGICFKYNWALPITARRPGAQA